jgi:hypothetical protein
MNLSAAETAGYQDDDTALRGEVGYKEAQQDCAVLKALRFMIKALLPLVLVFALCFSFSASALTPFEFSVEQAQLVMPDITVYFNAEDPAAWPETSVTASLGDVALETVDAGFTQDENDTLYIFIVDCSTSITVPQMNNIKQALIWFAENKKDSERLMLISFGESVNVLLNGDENLEDAVATIESLDRSESGTVLFDAVNRAVTLSENIPDTVPLRRVAVLFSDAEEFAVGSYTYDELFNKLTTQSLPIYAVGLNTGTTQSLNALGVLARSSGGDILVTPYDAIFDSVGRIADTVRASRKISFRAPTNEVSHAPENLVMQFTIDGETLTKEVRVVPGRWIPDTTPPGIETVEATSSNTLKIYFSEPVYGADNIENYLVGDGTLEYTVQQVTYIPEEYAAVLSLADVLENAQYTVTCMNVTDRSMEKNALSAPHTLTVGIPGGAAADAVIGGSVEGPVTHIDTGAAGHSWVPPLILLVAAAIIAAFAIGVHQRKKSRAAVASAPAPRPFEPSAPPSPPPAVEPRHHFAAQNVQPLRMVVTDQNGMAHQVDLKVTGSIFVGRSEICNLYFDDACLAAQHFVIEAKDGCFFVQDLGTPDGTFVNGVRVGNARKLNDRDTITAGQVTFVYHAG